MALEAAQSALQAEIDAVSNARMENNTLDIANSNEVRRRELVREEENRIESDDYLQKQIDSLAEAVLEILAIISENREKNKRYIVMAETAHTAWYRRGTVFVTNGITKVSGNGTKFLTAGINPGSTFRTDARANYASEVAEVVRDTELCLATPYYGQTTSRQTYSIDRNHQSTLPSKLMARLSKAMGNWDARYDLDMQTITGESAYEAAKRLSKTSAATIEAWLEELKTGAELIALKNLVDPVLTHNAGAHNSICRRKNLGVFSDAQSVAIRAGTFDDIYPSDFWGFSNIPYEYVDENDETKESSYSGTFRVADFDYYLRAGDSEFRPYGRVHGLWRLDILQRIRFRPDITCHANS